MKVYVQWAQRNARDWALVDSGAWGNAAQKPRPPSGGTVSGGVVLDQTPGWVAQLNVQGVLFGADVYAVEDLTDGSGGIRVTAINDDPAGLPAPTGWRNAQVWTFLPLFNDPGHGFQLNTRQSFVEYGEPAYLAGLPPAVDIRTAVRPWTDFVYPSATVQRFGIQLTDAQWAALLAAQTQHGWREWAV
jgi:hypothetical protein